MAWFKRQSGELDTSGEKKVRTEGLVGEVRAAAARSSGKRIWRRTSTSARSATDISASTPAPVWRSCSTKANTRFSTANLVSTDPLKFVDLKAYASRLKQAQTDTGLKDAVINARGKLSGRPVIVSAMEYAFIGGSMGAVVGEAITRAVEAGDWRRRRRSSSSPRPAARA